MRNLCSVNSGTKLRCLLVGLLLCWFLSVRLSVQYRYNVVLACTLHGLMDVGRKRTTYLDVQQHIYLQIDVTRVTISLR